MGRNRSGWILILAIVAGSVPALAQEGGPVELPKLLQRALDRADQQRFVGRRVVEFRRGPNQDRYEEIVYRDGANMRIEFDSGSKFAGQIIVEDGRQRRHFFPDSNEIRILPARRDEAMRRLSAFARRGGLKFAEGPGEMVAGQRTRLITVQDGEGNTLQRIMIEPRRAMILSRELFDPSGREVGSFAFKEIDFRARLSPDLFAIDRRGAKVVTPEDELRRLSREKGFQPRVLPRSTGYVLEMASVFPIEGREVLVQSYRSGESRLSLHQVVGPVQEERLRRFARGQTNVFRWQDANRTFVLIGELSVDQLRSLSRQVVEKD